jgi:hypothetical protein
LPGLLEPLLLTYQRQEAGRPCLMQLALSYQRVTLAFDQLLPFISQEQRSRAKVVMIKSKGKVFKLANTLSIIK